jgi:membrane-bound inhibitor of C-type lysozyme
MTSSTLLRITIIMVACTATLAGCGRKAGETTIAAQPPTTAATGDQQGASRPTAAPAEVVPEGVLLAYVWDCDDGTSLTMRNLLREKAIVLDLHEGPRHLPQVISASGAKYDDGTVSFWTKGGAAMFQRKGSAVVNCRDNRARSLAADARARGVAYRGQGNEPGWVLEISPPDRILFDTNYGQERHALEGTTVTGDVATGAEYRAEKDGVPIVATVTLEPCQDDMAGTQFDYSFVVQFGGRTYRGCGSDMR